MKIVSKQVVITPRRLAGSSMGDPVNRLEKRTPFLFFIAK